MRLLAVLLLVLALPLALLGCIKTVKARSDPALAERGGVHRIAVAPFSIGRPLSVEGTHGGPDPDFAATLISHQLSEALIDRGAVVVPPNDVGHVLRSGNAMDSKGAVLPGEAARLAASRFNADAILIGQVTRFEEREGHAAGATRPAAVSFRVVLRAAPSGQRLWSGNFDERQKPLGSNLFDASRLPGRGMRWLSAEELARWGAGQVGGAVPLAR